MPRSTMPLTIKHSTRTIARRLAITFTAALTAATCAQDLGIRAAPADKPVVIAGATIHTVSGETIRNGTVVFEDGVITAVLPENQQIALQVDPRIIEAQGMHVYPGLISPDTRIGLTEFGLVRATHDFAETVDLSPEVVAVTAVNPDSAIIPVTRSNGVLTAAVLPGGSVSIFSSPQRGLIAGTASVIRMDGWTTDDLALVREAGLVVNVPALRTREASWMNRTKHEQQDAIDRALASIEDYFTDAAIYAEMDEPETIDIRLEAARHCLPSAADSDHGQRPVFFRAADHDQITWALNFAKERGLKPVLVGARDVLLSVDLVRELNAGIILDTSLTMPKRDDTPIDANFATPRRLADLDIPFCIATGDRDANERNLPFSASLAVAYGLRAPDALRAITLDAARTLGIDDLGAIENGYRATLLITDGNPLKAETVIHHAFIDGREIDLSNKQTVLRDKYREKYRQLGLIEDDHHGDHDHDHDHDGAGENR